MLVGVTLAESRSVASGDQFDSILAAAQAGAEWAVTSLYRAFQPSLLRYLVAQVRDEAEDVAAEVWIDVAQALADFRGGEAGFRSWLFTIARRRAIDVHRRRTRRRTDPVADDDLLLIRAPHDPERQALDLIASNDVLTLLRDRLTPDQIEVVLLRVVAGLSAEEVGAIVGKRPGAVRAIQHRALLRLAKEIEPKAVT
jgi:RNA polymerase sigma-70 factor (ECF subfamily)